MRGDNLPLTFNSILVSHKRSLANPFRFKITNVHTNNSLYLLPCIWMKCLIFTLQKMGTAGLHSDIWIEVLFYLDIWINMYKMYAFSYEKSSINSKDVFLLHMISGQLCTFLYHFRRYLAFWSISPNLTSKKQQYNAIWWKGISKSHFLC